MNSRKSWLAVSLVGLVATTAVVTWHGTASGANQAAAASADGTRVAVVDLVTVFNEYELTKTLNQKMSDLEANLRDQDQKKGAELEAQAKAVQAFDPNSAEYKKQSEALFKLRVEYQVWKGMKQEEVGQKHLLWINATYANVEAEVAAIAKARGFQLVITREDLDTTVTDSKVMLKQIIGRKVIYSDASVDLTKDVLGNLNAAFQKAGGAKAIDFDNPPKTTRP